MQALDLKGRLSAVAWSLIMHKRWFALDGPVSLSFSLSLSLSLSLFLSSARCLSLFLALALDGARVRRLSPMF